MTMMLPRDHFARGGAAGLVRFWAERYARRLKRTSDALPNRLTRWTSRIVLAWAAFFLLASVPRILFAPTPVLDAGDFLALALPYLLIALAPLVGYHIARSSFPPGIITAQPEIRLSFYGKWRKLDIMQARANPLFGPAGFMASLLVGLLLNIVLRALEFLAAVPALNGHAPLWGQTLFYWMALDVVVMSFWYMVCFVMALRTVPLFPRMLLFAWLMDIGAQLLIANQVGAMPDLPPAVATSLHALLYGNVQKVLISACVWLPYLILSDRVNVTYRQRIAKRSA